MEEWVSGDLTENMTFGKDLKLTKKLSKGYVGNQCSRQGKSKARSPRQRGSRGELRESAWGKSEVSPRGGVVWCVRDPTYMGLLRLLKARWLLL